jgi:hypothetical protein
MTTAEQLEQRITALTAEIDRTSNCGHTARHADMEALAQQYYTPADDRIAERSVLRERLGVGGPIGRQVGPRRALRLVGLRPRRPKRCVCPRRRVRRARLVGGLLGWPRLPQDRVARLEWRRLGGRSQGQLGERQAAQRQHDGPDGGGEHDGRPVRRGWSDSRIGHRPRPGSNNPAG